jgi:hypothetical protein
VTAEAIFIYDDAPPAIVIETQVAVGSTIGGIGVYEGEELPAENDPDWPLPYFWRRPSDNRVVLVVDDGSGTPELIGFDDTFSDTFLD